MRETGPEMKAPEYLEKFGEQLGNGVRDFLATNEFALPSPFLRWGSPQRFSTTALGSAVGGRALVARLPELLRPVDLTTLVDRGRKKGTVTLTDNKKTWTEEQSNVGPATWYPDVAVEVGQVVAQLFVDSLERMAPRYLEARVAGVVEAETTAQQSLSDAPEPKGAILTSAPVDVLTLAALTSGAVVFDWPGYHLANPGAVGRKQEVRPVSFSIEPARNGSYWVRVTSPADPLPEEVALTLFGSTDRTALLTVTAPPIFGFGDASGLRPEVAASFTRAGINTTRVGDPVAEGIRGPLADEIALGQAPAPPGADKLGVLATLNESLLVLDGFTQIGSAFGIGKDPTLGDVTEIRARLVTKQTELAAADSQAAARWAGQVQAQRQVLSQAAFGFAGLVERFELMTRTITDATIKLGGFNLPPYVREALHAVARQYVDVAASSFFPATAERKLQAADLANRLLPVKILEGALAAVQRTVDDALEAKREKNSAHAAYDAEGMRKREIDLRARLGRARVKLLSDPMSAGAELAALQEQIVGLQTEAELVANMDQLDLAWQALDDSISIWFSGFVTRIRVGQLKAEGDRFHARWKRVFDLWKKGDKASRDLAKSQLETLRADPELGAYFGRLKATINDAQTEVLIGKIVAMLVITIVTAGVGEFVAGAALGAELSTGATLVAVGGAEALTFTVLSQILIDTDHSAGHVAYELATNLAMFGALRRFAAFAETAKLGRFTAAGGQAVLLGAMGLAKEEIAKYARTGKHLTREEIGQITLQSLVMFVALNGLGRLAQPILTEIRAEGTMLALKRNAANRAGAGLKAMQDGLVGSKDPAKALAYIEAERNWLQLKVKAYEELEVAATAEMKAGQPPKDGGVLKQVGMTLPEIAAMKAAFGRHLETMSAARTMLTLDPLLPNAYGAPRARIAEVLQELGGGTLLRTDPRTTVRTYQAKAPDGKKITVIEQLDPYERWVIDVRNNLTPVELAKFEKMTSQNTHQEMHDRYQGDKELAVRRVREDVVRDQEAAEVKVASTKRVAELKLKVADSKLMADPRVVAIIDALPAKGPTTTVSELRDYVMAKILASEAQGKARATEPDAEVLTGIKVYEKQPEATIAEWLSNRPGKTPNGLTPREDGLYLQRGEIDVLIIAREAEAKARVLHREEIKTGQRDTPADARSQIDDVSKLLAQGETGQIRLELNEKNITAEIDLTSDAAATKGIRGPASKGFDESLGVTAADLERFIKSLLAEAQAARTTGKDTE